MQAGCICSGKLIHISAAYCFRTWIVTAQGEGLGWGGESGGFQRERSSIDLYHQKSLKIYIISFIIIFFLSVMMPSFSYRKCLQTFAKKISTKEDDVDTVLNFSETVKHTSSTQQTVGDTPIKKCKPLTATFNKHR